MKKVLLVLFLLLPVATAGQSAPIDTPTAREYFEEVRQIGIADAGRLWGKSVAGPLLFVDPSTGSIVANRADARGLFKVGNGVWTGKLPDGMSPANTGIEIGGTRWAMIMWPLPDNRYVRRRLLLHESFHRVQDSLGLPATNPQNSHLAGADGRIWLRLEFRALTEALLRNGKARHTAIRHALTFRAKRHSLFPGAADDERLLEINEGLAEYTGLMLSGLPPNVLGDRVATQLSQQETQESQSRSFAYASGPAYALLLDDADSSWRRKVTAASDLASMVRDAYRITLRAADADDLIATYTGSRMVAAERARETNRVATEAKLRARFADGPTLTLPVAGKFSFSFDPNGAIPLAGLGTVYESSRMSDEWGSLVVSSGGVLLLRNPAGLITGVVLPGPAIKPDGAEGDGWKLTASPGWTATESQDKKASFSLIQKAI